MRVTLVQPPNGLHDRDDLAPPLGLLTIAAVLEADGVAVQLLDMNLRGIEAPAWLGDFYGNATRWIAESNPDVVGFTSMAVESHACLELARRIKREDPWVTTILGGPHFSAIAREVLELFPFIDYVVTGEGEEALRALLRSLRGVTVGKPLVNVAQRVAGGVVLERVMKPGASLAELPFPAYHLVDLNSYFRLNPMRLLDYESGRGCIFRCSFCYSPGQWGQGEQLKLAERVVEDTLRQERMGAGYLFFVQDNFLNSKATVLAMCDALAQAPSSLEWNCYATLPQITPEVATALAAARCREVFIGVDAVSTPSKKAFLKHFFKGWDHLRERLEVCLHRGITPTCAFMVDAPETDHRNTDAALTTALFARNLGCGIRLNTLTLYNGTASAIAMRDVARTYTGLKPELLLDTPRVLHDNPYARAHPELFPFHNTHLPLQLYERFVTGMHFAYTLFTYFPRTLLQYVTVDGGSPWALLDHLAARVGDLTSFAPRARRPIERAVFLEEFPRTTLSRATRAALDLETAELSLQRSNAEEAASVSMDGGRQTFKVKPFEVIDLPVAPPALAEAGGSADAGTGEPRPYLLTGRGGRPEPIGKETAHTLRRLSAARRTRGSVDIPINEMRRLIEFGVLKHTTVV